jgi:hypothetical protein
MRDLRQGFRFVWIGFPNLRHRVMAFGLFSSESIEVCE